MLHLANGQTTLELLRAAQVTGELRSAEGILMDGPLRNGLARPEDWTHRADWLDARFGIPKADYLVEHARIERAVRAGAERSEVVVWSEEDAFCQLNALYLLRRLTAEKANVSLVCPREGRLGRMDANALHELFLARRSLPEAWLPLAEQAWSALVAPDPREVERLLPELDAAWPALAAALRLHLARFPSTRDGLGRLDRALLRHVARAPSDFATLFRAALDDETVYAYGIGDVQAFAYLRQMAEGEAPLVAVDDPRALDDPNSGGVWRVTDTGQRVLDAAADAVTLRGVDMWLGGVRLEGQHVWRWDEDARRLVAPGG